MDELRGRFLQRIMILAAILGIVPVVVSFFGTNNLFLQVIYITVFLTLVCTIVFRLPYLLKARLFVVLPLILGISSTVNTGSRGDNIFFFLSYVFLSTLLIGLRSGLLAVVISEIIVLTTGYLVISQHFTLLDVFAPKEGLQDWATDSALLLLISFLVIAGLQMLQDGFKKAKIQNEIMVEKLEDAQKELEIHVANRTSELNYKMHQLSAALLTIHETAIIQELDSLLNRTVHLISEHFGYYHVGIYLMNQRGDYVTLQAASSEGGKKLLENGYRLRVGTEGIIGFIAAEKKPRISLDVGKDSIFFNSPELSKTQSELSLPLIFHSKVIGVLDMQSSEVNAFKYDDLDIFQTMADQIAVTIENTRLLSESQLVISQLETISNENTRQNWKTDLSTNNPIFHYSAIGVRPVEKTVVLDGKNVLDIPIVLRGQRIGKISLQRKSEFQIWTAQEKNVAKEVAAQAALALENIRLVERTQQRANREQAIAGISARVRETLDLDTVLRVTAREIQQALNLQEAEVRLIPQDNLGSEKNFE
jgi:GAF domain-containing protein